MIFAVGEVSISQGTCLVLPSPWFLAASEICGALFLWPLTSASIPSAKSIPRPPALASNCALLISAVWHRERSASVSASALLYMRKLSKALLDKHSLPLGLSTSKLAMRWFSRTTSGKCCLALPPRLLHGRLHLQRKLVLLDFKLSLQLSCKHLQGDTGGGSVGNVPKEVAAFFGGGCAPYNIQHQVTELLSHLSSQSTEVGFSIFDSLVLHFICFHLEAPGAQLLRFEGCHALVRGSCEAAWLWGLSGLGLFSFDIFDDFDGIFRFCSWVFFLVSSTRMAGTPSTKIASLHESSQPKDREKNTWKLAWILCHPRCSS